MTMRVLACVLAGILGVGVPATVVQDEPSALYKRLYDAQQIGKWSTERLDSDAAGIRGALKAARGYRPPAGFEKLWDAHIRDLAYAAEQLRRALLARGISTPAVVLSGTPSAGSPPPAGGANPGPPTVQIPRELPRGGDTVAVRPPGAPRKPSALALPLVIALTAEQLAICAGQGRPAIDCAEQAAGQTLAAAVMSGLVVAVVGPTGAPILTAIAAGGAVVSLVGTTATVAYEAGELGAASVEASGAEGQLRQQQERNAARITPDRMSAIIASFERDLAAAAIEEESARQLAVQALDTHWSLATLSDQARGLLREARELNTPIREAAAICRTPRWNPGRFTADIDTRLSAYSARADRVERLVNEARTLADGCADAGAGVRAKQRYEEARREIDEMSRQERDTAADTGDIDGFFAMVRRGRRSAGEAASRISALEDLLTEARRAEQPVPDAVEAYRTARDTAERQQRGLAVQANMLRAALPDSPPPHIVAGLVRIEALLPDTGASLDDNVLRAISRSVNEHTETNRIEGFLRQAQTELVDLEAACQSVPDTLPDAWRQQLTRLGVEYQRHKSRADTAFNAGREIPAKADACANRPPTTAAPAPASPCRGRLPDAILSQFTIQTADCRRGAITKPPSCPTCSDGYKLRFVVMAASGPPGVPRGRPQVAGLGDVAYESSSSVDTTLVVRRGSLAALVTLPKEFPELASLQLSIARLLDGVMQRCPECFDIPR